MTDKGHTAEIEIRQSLGDSGGFHGKSVEEMRIDDDTGFFTKDAWREEVRRLLKLAARFEFPGSIVMVDLDHLKAINDAFGHLEGGDKAIQFVADIIKDKLREVDVAGRLGGDEMVVYLPGANQAGAKKVADRVKDEIKRRVDRSEPGSLLNATKPTLSMGITQVKPNESLELAMSRVDVALYRAKDNGRDRIEVL
jgi:diguanylate cyclase (GGDEF)-like protein